MAHMLKEAGLQKRENIPLRHIVGETGREVSFPARFVLCLK